MRVFFGISIDGELQQSALTLINEHKNKPTTSNAKWTSSENLHMTLRFLGECDEEVIAKLCEAAAEMKLPSFDITTNGTLLLPFKQPHILALSIRLNNGLAELVKNINRITKSDEFHHDKHPFLPHITLARWKIPLQTPPHIKLQGSTTQEVKAFHLFKSESTDEGSIYTPIKTFMLESE